MTPLTQPLQAVVSLFEGPLSGVRFADVDAAGLSKLAAEVARTATELEQQEAKLSQLRQELSQRQDALHTLAQQALAYARIYAEGDDELVAQLNDIALPRASKPRKVGPAKASAEPAAEAREPTGAEAARADVQTPAAAEADEAAPLEPKPTYARPKVKRRLGRATSQSDSA
jgi:hypothetical protein